MSGAGKGDARERLFMAAVRVFAARGYKGATVREICAEAGANLNAVVYYFGGKAKLYQAVLEVLFTEGRRQMEERLAEAAGMTAEERLRLLLEVTCRLLFAGGELSRAFVRIYAQELINPSPFLGGMIERHSRTQVKDALGMVTEVVGPGIPHNVLVDCLMSLLGPAVYQSFIWPVMRPVFPDHPAMEEYWPRLADHLYRFSMAGLAAVREAAEEARHGERNEPR